MSKAKSIRCYDYVNHPYEEVRDALKTDSLTVFQHATKTAAQRAEGLSSELRLNVGGIEVGTDISISVNKVQEQAKEGFNPPATHIHLEWEASERPGWFPVMKADFSIYPLTATETQLDFFGNYEVPLGVLGNFFDSVVGHRVVDASVHRFIEEVAIYLRKKLSN